VLVAVVMVSVEAFPALTDAGLKLALAPAGSPLALSETLCAQPVATAVEIVLVSLPPWAMLRLAGLALMEKSLVAPVTVRATVVE
jgi:hypothetical protein